MKICYYKIWLNCINKFNLDKEVKLLMILDKDSSHLSDEFLKEINIQNILLN